MPNILPGYQWHPCDETHQYARDWYKPLLRPGASYVYVVIWPENLIIKAGFTSFESRWRKFMGRGAILHALFPAASISWEGILEDAFAKFGSRAFRSSDEAIPWLGAGGGGYTECYQFTDETWWKYQSIVEFARQAQLEEVA